MNFSTHFFFVEIKTPCSHSQPLPFSSFLKHITKKLVSNVEIFHYIRVIFSICSAQLLDTVSFDSNWENLHYIRNVDLNKGFVKETDLIEIKI